MQIKQITLMIAYTIGTPAIAAIKAKPNSKA
jgi:hypothetical protein